MSPLLQRPTEPTAAELTAYALSRKNYRGAATLILAGAAEVIAHDAGSEATAIEKQSVLTGALAQVATTR